MFKNLRQNRRRLEDKFFIAAFEDSQEAIVTLDAEGLIYSVSRGACELLERNASALLGQPWGTILLKDLPLPNQGLLPQPGQVWRHAQVSLLGRDNQAIEAFLTAEPLHEGAPPRLLGHLCWLMPHLPNQDLPIQQRLLRETFLRLQRLSTLGQITASFAHQMRSPIQIIQSNAEYALEFETPAASTKNNLTSIIKNSERLSRLIQSVLNMAKSGACQLEPAGLEAVIDSALLALEDTAKKKQIKISKSLAACPLLKLDPPLLQGALYNLMANAVEAMPDGGALEIKLTVGPKVKLLIQDSGPGMDPVVLSQAGEAFFSTKPSGTGLGVYMTRQILAQHGATLVLASEPKKGVAAVIEFPIQ
ncbi:MAG: hypothetical protein HY547_00925 [Elusimicrobia bacterium]|nr:hypothetical protein [Elusimicrobiota bacterium]